MEHNLSMSAAELKAFGAVWNDLSSYDATPIKRPLGKPKRNPRTGEMFQLMYIPWGVAYNILQAKYPGSYFEFHIFDGLDYRKYPDGSGEVVCTVTVLTTTGKSPIALQRTMWLPIYDYNHKSISNPSSDDVNTAKMRCFVKCLSLFGFGLNLFMGDMDTTAADIAESATFSLKDVASSLDTTEPVLREFFESVSGAKFQGASDKRRADFGKYLRTEPGKVRLGEFINQRQSVAQ